mmetsp:Transcript_16578/g.18438  ORF Transcript_16578/g.18438 Transcript_16578/m.18438 type:complete len:96 (-) Transcript_16578:1237-1524(-)
MIITIVPKNIKMHSKVLNNSGDVFSGWNTVKITIEAITITTGSTESAIVNHKPLALFVSRFVITVSALFITGGIASAALAITIICTISEVTPAVS